MAGRKMVPLAKFAVAIDPLCSRFEKLARLGMMTPQILSADDVRELAQLALDHITAEKSLQKAKA